MRVIYAEWQAYRQADGEDGEEFNENTYEHAYAAYDDEDTWKSDAENIWGWIEDLRTCTNGGFRAWVCPYGCHTVSFDRENEENRATILRPIDNGHFLITTSDARKLARPYGGMPKPGHETLVVYDDKHYWFSRTMFNGEQRWSIRLSYWRYVNGIPTLGLS